MSLHRQAARRDKNERAIIASFASMGVCTWRLSGTGLPDLLCGYRCTWFLVEIKSARGQLRPEQELFHTSCKAMQLPIAIVRSQDDVVAVMRQWGLQLAEDQGELLL